MSDLRDMFLQVLESYKEAVRAKNVAAFLDMYADDVHVFDMWGTWSLRGIDAWRSLIADWFSSLGNEQVVVGIDDACSTQIGELAVGHAILTYTAISADGQEIRSLSNRMTVALRRSGETWKIFHEHSSAPIDHASGKAMLQRRDG